MATASNVETPRMAVWDDVLGGNGPVTRAKARAIEEASQLASAANRPALVPAGHSTAARALMKPRLVGRHFADRLAAEQARVETEMSRLEEELERTKARLRNTGSDWDSSSERLLREAPQADTNASMVSSVSPPTTIGATQGNGSVAKQAKEPTVTQEDLQQVKRELYDSVNILLANIQQVVSAAVAEQIKSLMFASQSSSVLTSVASSIAQAAGVEGQSVASIDLPVTARMDDLSVASAVLTVPAAALTTATAPKMSCAGSVAVTTVSSARPGQSIMTVVSVSGSATGHHTSMGTANKTADQAVESQVATAVSNIKAEQTQASLKAKDSVKINAKLKPYAGGPGVEQYLAQFKMVARLNGWPEDEWGTILATFLDDKARRLLPRDPSAEPPEFSELSKQLVARFGHEGQPSYFAALLQSVSRRDGQSLHELRSAVEEMAERAYPGMEPAERRRVCLEPFINALTNEEQRKSVRLARPKDIDEAAEVAVVFENALKTEARKKGTRAKDMKEIRAVTMDTGEDKTVKYVEPERKQQAKGNGQGSQSKLKNERDAPVKAKQTQSNANMEARMDALMNEMAAMTATIRSLAMGANSVPNSQGRSWQTIDASNARPRMYGSQMRVTCFQCGKEGHVRRDCQASRQGNDPGRRPEGHGVGQFQ